MGKNYQQFKYLLKMHVVVASPQKLLITGVQIYILVHMLVVVCKGINIVFVSFNSEYVLQLKYSKENVLFSLCFTITELCFQPSSIKMRIIFNIG